MMNSVRARKALVVGLLVIAVSSELAWAVNGTWTTKTSMPTKRYGPGIGVVNGIVYAVGGYNGAFLNTLEAYNPTTDTWSTKASMPTAREELSVGVVNGILYAVGGENGAFLNTVEAYDPSTNTWSTKAPMPTGRYGPGVGVVNGIVYAVGGFDGTSSVNTLESYNPSTNTWSTKTPMPTGRYALGVGVVNGIVYAVGGSIAPANIDLNTVEAYNPSTDTWTSVASMPTVRRLLGVGVVKGILYALAGYNHITVGVVATNEAFASPFFAAFLAKVDLDVNSSSFELNSFFTLGTGRSIAPTTQDVSVQVGGYSVTIPAGSFHYNRDGNLTFEGRINGVALEASLRPLGGNRYFFQLEGAGASNLPTQNPVTVGLTIGDNTRSVKVNADFK